MSEAQLSPDVQALVLNRSLPGISDPLFFFDPLYSPSEFKCEVVEWLQDEPDLFPIPSSSTYDDDFSRDEVKDFKQLSATEDLWAVPTPPLSLESIEFNFNDDDNNFMNIMAQDSNNLENVLPNEVLFNDYSPYYQMLSPPSFTCISLSSTQHIHLQNGTPPSAILEKLRQPPSPVQSQAKISTRHKDSVCTNCQTNKTSMWRWNKEGLLECNACNMYETRNQKKRPVALRKDRVLKRKRKPRCPTVATSMELPPPSQFSN